MLYGVNIYVANTQVRFVYRVLNNNKKSIVFAEKIKLKT